MSGIRIITCVTLLALSSLTFAKGPKTKPEQVIVGEGAQAQQPVFPAPPAETVQHELMENLAAVKNKKKVEGKAKNVILFIGDGMGISTITAARILEGQQKGQSGEENKLSFEEFPHVALSKVYNTNQQTPDSAGTMTAMMSGLKTKAGVIGVSDSALRGDARSAIGASVFNLVEVSELIGKSTGVISTARITHATPAACYAHSPERNWEADSNLPADAKKAGYPDIASQLIDFPYGDGLEVAMGGGRRYFYPASVEDPEDAGSMGSRTDGRNLTQEWMNKYNNAAYVYDREGFDALGSNVEHLLGLFERSHMEYEVDRAGDTGGEPSLTEMTGKALEILSKNEDGYFLMVEAGRIDHGHHAGNAYRALTDTIAFSDAVRYAVENVDLEETLILVTADHSHVFTIGGYPTRGNNILGNVISNDGSGLPANAYQTDATGMPMTTLGYFNGPGYVGGQRPDLTEIDTTDSEYRQEAAVPMSSETHSAEDVAIFAIGPGSEMVNGVLEQNFIFHVMRTAIFMR